MDYPRHHLGTASWEIPGLNGFSVLESQLQTEVCANSVFPQITMHWIKGVEKAKSADDPMTSQSTEGGWVIRMSQSCVYCQQRLTDNRTSCATYRVLHRIGTFSLGCVATKVPIATHSPFFSESQVCNLDELKNQSFFDKVWCLSMKLEQLMWVFSFSCCFLCLEGTARCVTRTVLLTPSASVSIWELRHGDPDMHSRTIGVMLCSFCLALPLQNAMLLHGGSYPWALQNVFTATTVSATFQAFFHPDRTSPSKWTSVTSSKSAQNHVHESLSSDFKFFIFYVIFRGFLHIFHFCPKSSLH